MEEKKSQLDKSPSTSGSSSSSLEDDNFDMLEVANTPLQEAGTGKTTGLASDIRTDDKNITSSKRCINVGEAKYVEERPTNSAENMISRFKTMQNILDDLEDSSHSSSFTSVSSLSYNSQMAAEQLDSPDCRLQELKLDTDLKSKQESHQSSVKDSSPNTESSSTIDSLSEKQIDIEPDPKSGNTSSDRLSFETRSISAEKQEIVQENTDQQRDEDMVQVGEDTMAVDEVCDKSSSSEGDRFTGVHKPIGKRKRNLKRDSPCMGPGGGFSVSGKLRAKLEIKKARNIFTDETTQETSDQTESTMETIQETPAGSSTEESFRETLPRRHSTEETIRKPPKKALRRTGSCKSDSGKKRELESPSEDDENSESESSSKKIKK